MAHVLNAAATTAAHLVHYVRTAHIFHNAQTMKLLLTGIQELPIQVPDLLLPVLQCRHNSQPKHLLRCCIGVFWLLLPMRCRCCC